MSRLGLIARDVLHAAILAVLLGLLLRTFVIQVYRVPSTSMEPLLRTGDLVMVNKLVQRTSRGHLNPWLPQRHPAKGDVLVFPQPLEGTALLVKRCVASSGEILQIKDKVLLVNRERVEEPYIEHQDSNTYSASSFLPEEVRVRDQFGPIIIAEGGLFCLGDNRDRSRDSRHWGEVESSSVVGQAVVGFRRPWHAFRIR